MGCNRVMAESDSSLVIEAVNNAENYYESNVATIMECYQLPKEFGMINFGLCKREANEVADCLAKSCYSSRSPSLWDNTALDFISSLIVRFGCLLINKIIFS